HLVCRRGPAHAVVAFTATQIPNIDARRCPPELAGSLYPEGIPILPESALEELVRQHEIDVVVFAYSDVTHEHVMHIGSRALAAGASFELIAPRQTMLASSKPTVAICAVRTGSGKSQTTRRVAEILRDAGTTTHRSSSPTCTSSSWIRTARDTSCATTPVRRTSAWRTSVSSTRWTARRRRASMQF